MVLSQVLHLLTRYTPDPAPATINRITYTCTALLDYLKYANQPKPRKGGYGSASSRTAEQQELANRYATNLIDNIPNTDIIVYTDGSSLGNPGPAGAGYYIKFPAAMGLEDKQMVIPLSSDQ